MVSVAWLAVILLALAGLSLLAWSVRALDMAGAVAAFVLGLLVAVVAGIGWLVLMTTFTLISVAATRLGVQRKRRHGAAEGRDGERGLRNVLANGLAPTLAALAVLFLEPDAARLAFVAAVAAVTADTLASEIGALAPRARSIVPPFVAMRPGQNGGVSWLGQGAAAVGAIVIAFVAVPLTGLPWSLVVVPAVAGWLGCQLDSLLGATLERDAIHDRPLNKEDVNFLASAVPAFLVLLAAHLALSA